MNFGFMCGAIGAQKAARFCLEEREWDAAVFNAVQAAISASDALCAYYLKKRYAGQAHQEAAALLSQLPFPTKEKNVLVERFYRLVGMKSRASYQGSAMTEKQAAQAYQDMERFLEVLKRHIGFS